MHLSGPGIFWIRDAYIHVDILQELQTCVCPEQIFSPKSSLSALLLPWLLKLGNDPLPPHILWISFSHLSPSPSPCPSPCPHCLFLCSSENRVTTLPKSGFPPFNLYTAARKILKHRSDQVRICFKVCSDCC